MNKRVLTKLAKAGFFNSANGVFYAATKHAMRKPLHIKNYQIPAEAEPEVFNNMPASRKRQRHREVPPPEPAAHGHERGLGWTEAALVSHGRVV
ncbi:MAG: hypothetical protein ONB46_16365 [candidate division KSB1 bacterium]|nr:hypothetical protein [candidate division KSB1 bacterium]MDZ7367268.1 hypothetical protein [candidate division KSB1 bacterium]MDZ7405893.1 hypothetical protein [candidate division KSB1 bacterium]